ncbi:MAG: nucleoside deaminase [Myxococcota bacterium]|jgi:tRNA(Arg) A34 adenosine deaminase TadA|nr:nucleoside deaminase [Myxococcota bacterium]
MPALPTSFTLDLPDWLTDLSAGLPADFPTLPQRMALVNDLARRNVAAGSGGPFAAAVFERDRGRLVSLGVNRVVPLGLSCAHAEVMALSLAQQALGSWDLGAPGLPAHQLVVNWRPCAMCFGATLWSGVVDLVIAGDGPELESLTGFDEGPLPATWPDELRQRRIALTVGVGRDEAVALFASFGRSGAPVYNGRGGGRR